MNPPCPDLKCDGAMEHWQRSIRYRCTACERFFDFVLATDTKYPHPVPVRADRVGTKIESEQKMDKCCHCRKPAEFARKLPGYNAKLLCSDCDKAVTLEMERHKKALDELLSPKARTKTNQE